jgi:DNA-binding NtrC family response regulator
MSRTEAAILIADDDPAIRTAAQMFLKQLFTVVVAEEDPANIPLRMKDQHFDVILLDMNFTQGKEDGSEGIHWLGKILEQDPGAVVVFVTAFGGIDLAVEAMRSGAFDFIVKPWKNEKLLGVIRTALKLSSIRREAEKYRQRQEILMKDMDQESAAMIGRSPAMQKVFDTVDKVAGTDADVLLLGENGSGKEVIAREIHRRSARRGEVFIPVDLGAVHGNLFESELFGHVQGAFTDAEQDRPGRFEVASGGTLFLDEIGNLSGPLQAKLLSVIENRKVIRLGSNREVDINVRLISATNRPLGEMVRRGEFREDLLYRINTVEIRIPPLRQRTGDVRLLAEFFLRMYSRKYHKTSLRIPPSTMARLEKYDWPGNVRELRHAVERAVILCEGGALGFGDLLTDRAWRTGLPDEDNLNLAEMEKRYILKAIARNRGNITRAASDLGIARAALYRRLQKYGI